MSFQPIIPMSGLGGWAFLSRTRAKQEASFNATPMLQREATYFREKIAEIRTADDLVKDRRLLRVALGAFGLQQDLDSRAFIRQVIEGGTDDRRALANRLADKRYLALAQGFAHLAKGASQTTAPDGLAERLITQFKAREFEVAVGEQDQNMRMALALQRDLPALVQDYKTEKSRWYALLGNPPLRQVVETSLGLPKEFGLLDIDDQVIRMRKALQQRFGTSDLRDMADPDSIEKVTRRFMVMQQLREIQSNISPGNAALFLLQNTRRR